jgi:hypothetical protein
MLQDVIVRNVCNGHRRGGDEVRTVSIWKRPTEKIKDLTTREEFFNEYWWAE